MYKKVNKKPIYYLKNLFYFQLLYFSNNFKFILQVDLI